MDVYGIDLVSSDYVEEGTMLVLGQGGKVYPYQDRPRTIKGEATKIVQDGLSDVLAWLQASGHHISGWRTVDYLEQRYQQNEEVRGRALLEWRTATEASFRFIPISTWPFYTPEP